MFTNKRYAEAFELYTKAIELSNEQTENVHIFYANRAISLMEMSKYSEALDDSKKAIELNPTYVKAYI
jgi:tetratricopeptide (TPR) repeat protein